MPTPEEGVRRREAGELLERFLSTLDAPAREAFYLSQIEGLRAREVAELVDANINTVNTRIRTARIRFEKFVAERQSTPRTEIRANVCRA